jgi:hypothetical protein
LHPWENGLANPKGQSSYGVQGFMAHGTPQSPALFFSAFKNAIIAIRIDLAFFIIPIYNIPYGMDRLLKAEDSSDLHVYPAARVAAPGD